MLKPLSRYSLIVTHVNLLLNIYIFSFFFFKKGRWKLHVAVFSLNVEFCCSRTRLLQPRAVFSGFATAPRIPLTAPASGVPGLCKNLTLSWAKQNYLHPYFAKKAPTFWYQTTRRAGNSHKYYFIFHSSLPLCQSQKFKANFIVNSATRLPPYWTFFWAV